MRLSGYGYLCAAGESFDSIAREIYGDENYAAELLCANPEHCRTVVFAGGEKLYLPTVAITESEGGAPQTPPWKE